MALFSRLTAVASKLSTNVTAASALSHGRLPLSNVATQRFSQFSTSSLKRADKEEEACSRSKAADQKAKILKEKTPQGKLEDQKEIRHPYQEKEPLPEHPGGVNPETGEVGGPKGPEPTRYGDWERKGRVTDF